jgi:hypothetical protein
MRSFSYQHHDVSWTAFKTTAEWMCKKFKRTQCNNYAVIVYTPKPQLVMNNNQPSWFIQSFKGHSWCNYPNPNFFELLIYQSKVFMASYNMHTSWAFHQRVLAHMANDAVETCWKVRNGRSVFVCALTGKPIQMVGISASEISSPTHREWVKHRPMWWVAYKSIFQEV